MKRNSLLKLLENYSGESTIAAKLINFVEADVDCFERSNEAGHITASCWLVSRDGQRVLLTHHRKLNKWLQPGGHCDGDSDVLRAALKEAREESGIEEWELVEEGIFDIDTHLIPARPNEPEHFHYDVRFLFRAVENEQYVVSHESHDLAWVEHDQLNDYTTEKSMNRMSGKWQTLVKLGVFS
jgi:8-oxo-dGTP pyrophosphatase MutT (NUDIX family)